MFPQLDALVIVVLLVLILAQIVIWRIFGRIVSLIRHPGSLVETVGVAVHLPRVQVPVQVQSGGDAGMAHDLLQQEPAPIGRTNAERGPRPCPKQALTCNVLVQTNRSLPPELSTPRLAGA